VGSESVGLGDSVSEGSSKVSVEDSVSVGRVGEVDALGKVSVSVGRVYDSEGRDNVYDSDGSEGDSDSVGTESEKVADGKVRVGVMSGVMVPLDSDGRVRERESVSVTLGIVSVIWVSVASGRE